MLTPIHILQYVSKVPVLELRLILHTLLFTNFLVRRAIFAISASVAHEEVSYERQRRTKMVERDLPSSSNMQPILIEYPASNPAVAVGKVGASLCFTTKGPAKFPQQ